MTLLALVGALSGTAPQTPAPARSEASRAASARVRTQRIPSLRKYPKPKIENIAPKTTGKTSHSMGTTTPTTPALTDLDAIDVVTLDLNVFRTPQVSVTLVGTTLNNHSLWILKRGLWIEPGGRVDFFPRASWISDRALLVECDGSFPGSVTVSFAKYQGWSGVGLGELTFELDGADELAFVVPATSMAGYDQLRLRMEAVADPDRRVRLTECTFTRL
ncbi:MAG TPA: hypothetical protein VG755_44125 [Nannocystaceae bacterium]|nr:hypothetical protein [Nannocystaceae bacterium]